MPKGRESEGESVRICMTRERDLFVCGCTLHTHQLFIRYLDVLTQLKFIATIHDVNNLRPPQPSTISNFSNYAIYC